MPSKKSSIVPAQWMKLPARWMKVPPRRRKVILALAGVCTAGIVLTIGQPSPIDTPRVDISTIESAANEPVVTQRASRPRATPVAAVAATSGSAPARASAARAVQAEAATITGCLEADGDSFRLKDVEGEDAPKARSWKSGFLRRSNARVDVVDAGNRLRLASHVGHRVTVAGMLADRELDARSLRMTANSCED